MVREAEENKEEDQKRREVVDTRNSLDAMILAAEKMLKDGEGKISAEAKTEVENAVTEAKGKLESESLDELKAASEALQTVTHKVATEMYQQQGGQPGAEQQAEAAGGEQASAGGEKKDDDDVVDADFKEV